MGDGTDGRIEDDDGDDGMDTTGRTDSGRSTTTGEMTGRTDGHRTPTATGRTRRDGLDGAGTTGRMDVIYIYMYVYVYSFKTSSTPSVEYYLFIRFH